MYTLGAIDTSWVRGDIPAVADINRVEGNIGAANYHNFTQGVYLGIAEPLGIALAAYSAYAKEHYTQTGRILVSCAMSFNNIGASLNRIYGTVEVGGTNLGGTGGGAAFESAATEILASGDCTIFFSHIRTGLTPNSNITIRPAARRGGGTNINMTHYVVTVVDI